MKKQSKKQNTKERMYPLVEKWESSGQSKTAYCRDHGLNIHTFIYWHQKYKTEHDEGSPGTSDFVALELRSKAVKSKAEIGRTTGIEIVYPNGVRLHLEDLVRADYIMGLVKMV